MSTPWPPPAGAAPTAPAPRTPDRWAAWTAVLVLVVALILTVPAVGGLMTWASGELGGSRPLELNAGDLVNRGGAGYATALVAAYLGLFVAACLGLVAAPVSAGARWATGLVFTALGATLVGATLADSSDTGSSHGETVLIAVVVTVPPLAVLLLLLARGARRGAAVTALVCAGVAAVAQLVTLVRLVVAPADVGPGTWLVTGAVLLGLAAAVLLVRAVPRQAL